MRPAFPASDYHGSSASMMDIRVTPLPFRSCRPSFICWTNSVSVRLPVAVFIPCLLQVDAVASVWLCSPLGPRKTPYICARVRVSPTTYPSTPFSIPPVKPCRWRRHFSPQTRVNRFVFLNLPILSLGNYLGVTVSPQSPLPAGYVTLPVDSRLPPLGLMLPHSRKQARQIPPFSMHSKHMPPRFLGARRTAGDVNDPIAARAPAKKLGCRFLIVFRFQLLDGLLGLPSVRLIKRT